MILLASAAVAAIGLSNDGSFGQRWPIVALAAGALLGAVLVLHQGLAWPLAIACGASVEASTKPPAVNAVGVTASPKIEISNQ